MKRIAIEEHFIPKAYGEYLHSRTEYPKRDYIEENGQKLEREQLSSTRSMVLRRNTDKAIDIGEGRLKDMDDNGIDIQVLSSVANLGIFNPEDGTYASMRNNDNLAEIIQEYPERFSGFAALALQSPEAAADELKRAVKELGLKGAMIMGHVGEEYLDNPKYWPIFEMAEKLDVPIYLHPAPPSPDMIKPYLAYPGLSMSMWGFTAEASLHALRLICSGIFEKYPRLKIILGHMGETLPYMFWRLDNRWSKEKSGEGDDPEAYQAYKHLKKSPSQYFRDNFYITTSGMAWPPVLQFACSVLGADRILFATDYPAESIGEAVQAVDSTPISDDEKEKVYHLNAEKLLKL